MAIYGELLWETTECFQGELPGTLKKKIMRKFLRESLLTFLWKFLTFFHRKFLKLFLGRISNGKIPGGISKELLKK